jgi:hypothetical protein
LQINEIARKEEQLKKNAQDLDDFINTLMNTRKEKLDTQITELMNKTKEDKANVQDLWREAADPKTSPERRTAIAEIIGSLSKVKGATIEAEKGIIDLTQAFTDQLTAGVESATSALVDFATGTQKSFSDMIISILKDMAKLILQMQLTKLMAESMGTKETPGWLGTLITAGAKFFAGTNVPADVSMAKFYENTAMGGAFSQGRKLTAYGSGGIFDTPHIFPMANGAGVMGEAGPEAVMPLTRGPDGKLGVQASGSSGMTVNIYNQSSAQVKTEESKDEHGSTRLDIMVTQAVNTGLGNGAYDRVLSTSFGLSRKGR